MIGLIADAVLLLALVFTAATMVSVRRKLKRLDAEHAHLADVLADMTDAIDAAETTIAGLRDEGCAVVLALGNRIDEARALLRQIEGRAASPVAADRRARARGYDGIAA